MDKKTDLRVIKTKKRIKQVFLELIGKKELKKITVTELARLAEINKGTFYLHYKDIYELYSEVTRERINDALDDISFYNEFFDDPEAFVYHLYRAAGAEILSPRAIENGFQADSGTQLHFRLIGDALRERIYLLGRIERNEQNDIKLDYIFFNLCFFLRTENAEKKYPILSELIVSDIRTAFPETVK